MADTDAWSTLLDGHLIFSLPSDVTEEALELSLDTLPSFSTSEDVQVGQPTLAGRKQLMCMKDSDLILACGSEIRMASLNEAKASGGSRRNYKILHTPNITFNIRQICLCPNRKLLAVAGASEVAVIVLPRTGYSKMVTARIDCKSLQIGQRHHTSLPSCPPIVKIDWHPWGDAGSTLLVMTIDGVLREYDVSFDPEEPRATLEFFPDRRQCVVGVDDSEREVVSFAFGKGKADWGPLTVYALTRSGDVYAICPYMPQHASIPSSYIHALECYVSAKQEFLTNNAREHGDSFSILYDYQRKFVNSLMKQLPSGTISISRPVQVHTPTSLSSRSAVQGPFLMQPAPVDLDYTCDGDATDLLYVATGGSFNDDEEEDESTVRERLGMLLIAYQDGRVDVCLDVEKVEARWEGDRKSTGSLPSLSVYESIDLGIIKALTDPYNGNPDLLRLLQGNHAVIHQDPIYDDTVYVYHALGVHVLNFGSMLNTLAAALNEEDENRLADAVEKAGKTSVKTLLSTFNVDEKSSSPVAAVAIPSDVYLTYSIFILTTTMRIVIFPLNLRAEAIEPAPEEEVTKLQTAHPTIADSKESPSLNYASYIKATPYNPPAILQRPVGLASIRDIPLPKSHSVKTELVITPETLRYLSAVAERLCSEKHEAIIAFSELKSRLVLHSQEIGKQQQHCQEIVARTNVLNGPRKVAIQAKLKALQEEQQALLHRMDRALQALINNASPELNEHEKKWFEELRRMKGQTIGVGRYDPTSIKNRVQLLRNEFDRLLPELKALSAQEHHRGANGALQVTNLPQSALFKKASTEERMKLDDAVKQITKLANKLEITSLGKPPIVPS